MKDKVYDLAYLHNGLDELESYLLSDELFFPVMGSPPGPYTTFIKLTLSNLLLSLQRLSAYEKSGSFSPEERHRYLDLKQQFERIQSNWQLAWRKKADKEYPSRFIQWTHVLNELIKDREKNAPFYSSEVRTRVLLTLLAPHTREAERYDIGPLDAILRKMLNPAPCIWGEELSPGFPQDQFWYLYGDIPS